VKPKHDWQSLNRDAHSPEHMTLNDLFEEIRCAVYDDDVQDLAFMLDEGRYAQFGTRLGMRLRLMRGGPNNKTAPRKRA